MARWIFHIDMDAFYASVEQYRLHPEFIGQPVCVGPDPRRTNGRGVVRAASYEARAFGIHSGMSVAQAYQLCPDAVFLMGSFSNYFKASDEVMTVIEQFSDVGVVRRASIDEAYIEVTQKVQEHTSLKALALELQQRIRDQTKLPCSIGIGPNMAVAKIATSINKPMGITLVPQDPEGVLQFLAPLDVTAINGVGQKTANHLYKHGIKTLGQIQQMSITDLYPLMRRGAKWLHDRARGIDERPIHSRSRRIRKSIGKDRTFMEHVTPTSINVIQETLNELCSRIGQKLQDKSFHFRTITVKIRFSNYETIQRSRTLNFSTDDQGLLCTTALDLFKENHSSEKSIRLVGVRVSNLTPMKGQSYLAEFFP